MVKDSISVCDSTIFVCGTAFVSGSHRVASLPIVPQGGLRRFYHIGVVQADICLAFMHGSVHDQILEPLLLRISDLD